MGGCARSCADVEIRGQLCGVDSPLQIIRLMQPSTLKLLSKLKGSHPQIPDPFFGPQIHTTMSGLRREYFEDWSKLISKYQAVWKRLITEHYKRKRWGVGGMVT